MKQINKFIDSELTRRSRQWQRLKLALDNALPEEFRPYVSYATLDNEKLTIFTESPGWTSRLRFHDAEIIENFQSVGIRVTAIQARTVPKPEPRPQHQ